MADELVSIRVRLSGGSETAREAKVIGTEIRGVGAAATEANLASARGASGIHRTLGRLSSAWGAVKRVGRIAAGGALAAGAAALIWGQKATKGTEELAKATVGLHKNMGFSYEKASALLSLFKVRGAEPTKVALGFKAFATQLRSAATGSESAIGYFRKLGFSQKDIQRSLYDSEFALNKVSKGFAGLPPSLAKSALGAKVFGKAYEAMFPLLREGPGVLHDQIEKAKEYGAVMNGHAVTSTMDMVEAQRELQLASIGWQITFATKIEPVLIRIVTAIAKFTNGMRTGTGAGGKFAAIMRVTGQVLSFTFNAIKDGVVWIVGASKAVAAWSAGAARAVAGGFRDFLGWITTTWRNVTGFIGALLPVKAALSVLGAGFKIISAAVSGFAKLIGPVLGFGLHLASVAITNVWKGIKFMATIISDVIGIVSNLLRGKWGAAWTSAKGLVGDVVHGIGEFLGGMLSFLGSLPGKILGVMKGVGKAIAAPFIWAWKKIEFVKEKIDAITGALNGSPGPTVKADPSLLPPGTAGGPAGPKSHPPGPGSGITGAGTNDPTAPTPIVPRPRLRGEHPGARPRSRSRAPLPEARGREGLSTLGRSGGRGRARPLVVQIPLDGRVIAERTIELQEDDEARE